jgi:hypothetical protein
MIPDTARYHGSFFVLLFDRSDVPISVERISSFGPGFYLLEQRIPVYLKLSSKRKGPWIFNFLRSHQEAQKRLFGEYGECFTCLICSVDGIVGLNMNELREVLNDDFEEQEAISVRRRLNSMYQIKGRNGVLENRISRHSVFDKLYKILASGDKA